MNQSSKISCKYEYLHLTQNDVGYTAGKLLPRVRLTGENCLHLQLTVYTETLPLASLTGPYYSTVFINMTLLFQETPGQEDISYKQLYYSFQRLPKNLLKTAWFFNDSIK